MRSHTSRLVTTLAVLASSITLGTIARGTTDPTANLGDSSLTATDTGPCAGAYRIGTTDLCTHGGEPVPPALVGREPTPIGARAAAEGPLCEDDGTSGKRVQAIYVRPQSKLDRYTLYANTIRAWAVQVDTAFNSSAAETGGSRHVRWVTDATCVLDVKRAVVSDAAATSFGQSIEELRAQGFNRDDRKYLYWMESSQYCGIATLYYDDSKSPTNANNVTAGYARVDTPCWGYVESHELMHTLGGVQPSAPNSTGAHCTDEADAMCYSDAPGVVMRSVCPSSHEDLFDCRHDDYFHTNPPAGNYLATHWNTADSGWLSGSGTVQPPPDDDDPPPDDDGLDRDQTDPACGPVTAMDRRTLFARTSDDDSGLKSVTVVSSSNLNVTLPVFAEGTNRVVEVRASKYNKRKAASLTLLVTDVAGNSSQCGGELPRRRG